MNIIYVPLERLESRYTSHLDKDILYYLRSNRLNYERIDAPFNEPPAQGMFLNASETIKNKSNQLFALAEMYANKTITDNTIIFFSDLWFPGIESLAYLNHFYKVRPQIRGIIHAGSFTDTDEVRKMERWAKNFEDIVFDIADKIFCGSKFIKNDILSKRIVDERKLIVTGLPLDSSLAEYYNDKKENIVVFNGRNHPEKQPHLFNELKRKLSNTGWEFIATHELNLNKADYYRLLARSKIVVSFALQENFGYGIAEAVSLGCIPILPNRLAYRELYAQACLYDSFEDCITLIKQAMAADWWRYKFENPNPFKTWFE